MLSNQEILEKVIKKANKAGFGVNDGWLIPTSKIGIELMIADRDYYKLIFNHDFAKSIWGEEPGLGATPGFIDDAPNWQYHLMLMVIAENPLDYLKDNI